jgi:hypothetical protein
MQALDKADTEQEDEINMIGIQLEMMMRIADEIGGESHNQEEQM